MNECSKLTIPQCKKSCFFPYVMFLLSKIPSLNKETRDYVNSLQVCTSEEICNNPLKDMTSNIEFHRRHIFINVNGCDDFKCII